MKRVIITLAVIVVALLLTNQAHAGTLDRGVHVSAFFVGGFNGPSITQLKYQMAIDSKIGITERYTTIMYTYNYDYSTQYNSGTFNTFDVDVSTNASGSTAQVILNNNTYQN